MVLLWLVMQDAMRAVFEVWPEVRIKEYVNDTKFHVQAERAEEATAASGWLCMETTFLRGVVSRSCNVPFHKWLRCLSHVF